MTYTNPILTGFHPDPSIIRVGKDYFLATSTFEWFPGVQIFHSTDLVNWELVARPLDSVEKLDMRGVPDSCGVWAPCLSYDQGTYYLVYSNVKSFDGMCKDTPNYLVMAKHIEGPWSAPIFLNASGFDGSLFHDEDGKKYYLSMLVDHRHGKFFGGIVLQEYDSKKKCLVGRVHHIYEGSPLGITEGPHLYKRDGYYYLLTAEGGTEYGHAVSLARSKNLLGPYETHPQNPLISAAKDPEHPLQKTGHGDCVWTESGNCYIVFLTGRPLSKLGRCTLGRETAIEKLYWPEGEWPFLEGNTSFPRTYIPELPSKKEGPFQEKVRFEEGIPPSYQSLRISTSEDWILREQNPGFLTLLGQESLSSTFSQSLLARRVQHFHCSYTICMEFSPNSFQHMAGLVCYYNTGHHYYLHMTNKGIEGEGKVLRLSKTDNFAYSELLDPAIDLPTGKIHLRVIWDRDKLRFSYKVEEANWIEISKAYDGSILSDDYVRDGSDRYRPAFTGAFLGICCQDLTGNKHPAHFEWADYQELTVDL
ncbi:MAG: glycoside hydrolase family 43 protein [Bacteroidota bacterium]